MDRISGGVVLCLAAAILWQGRGLAVGSLRAPGPGFFPLLIAAALILLSLALIAGGDKRIHRALVDRGSARRLILVCLSLLAYVLLLESLGFVLTSFLFMASLFMIVAIQKWYVSLLWALVATGFAYSVFEVLLKSNLPKGVFGI